ncbi:MAG: hypothetical protein SVP26_02160 [Chloroflexota bacterium]|nr:hypothetical protein [Chloroflexota bacterium]
MTSWEDKLPPIARERLARAGDVTPEERERMKDSERVDSLLSEFYREGLSSEGLWAKLRQYVDEGKGHLLTEVQSRLVDSLSLGSNPLEIEKRKTGLVAIESLKAEQNTPALEAGLSLVEELRRRYGDETQQVYDRLRAEVEKNPRLRMEQVKQGQNTMLVQLTVDEAVKRLPQWGDFLVQHENRYAEEFSRAIHRLKADLGLK